MGYLSLCEFVTRNIFGFVIFHTFSYLQQTNNSPQSLAPLTAALPSPADHLLWNELWPSLAIAVTQYHLQNNMSDINYKVGHVNYSKYLSYTNYSRKHKLCKLAPVNVTKVHNIFYVQYVVWENDTVVQQFLYGTYIFFFYNTCLRSYLYEPDSLKPCCYKSKQHCFEVWTWTLLFWTAIF